MSARNLLHLIFLLCMALSLNGCFGTTPPSRFYSLTPQEYHTVSFSNAPHVYVKIGPIAIPSYLDRRQIVTRTGRNEIVVSEYDLWGGSLEEEITQLLVGSLAEQLVPKGIVVIPWRSLPVQEGGTTYRIFVSVNRFDGTPGETAVLNAFWGLLQKKEKGEETLLLQETTITEVLNGKGYDSLVSAMGKILDRLGKEIGGSISSNLPSQCH